jgi:hypothetical protein
MQSTNGAVPHFIISSNEAHAPAQKCGRRPVYSQLSTDGTVLTFISNKKARAPVQKLIRADACKPLKYAAHACHTSLGLAKPYIHLYTWYF